MITNETIHSLASSRNHTGNDAIDNVDNYVKEWCRVNPEEETKINRNTMKLQENLYKALKQRDQFKAERDTLIDDLSWYKAKVSRLEENNDRLTDSVKTLERKNADARTLNWELKGYADMYKEDSDEYKTLLSEISQHIGNKPSSSTYKYFRAKLDNLNITEDK